jgi:hypothetical protein
MAGTPAHARVLIAKAEATGKLRELADRVSRQTGTELGDRDPRADIAFVLGGFYGAENRTEQADAAYELALEYDSSHPWACNNLGYSLLERGGDLDRAGRLLERAHATLPGEAAITDSLGWLRYKQGLLEDQRGADGMVSRRGAISLLRAAAMTDRGQRDPTILDHLGDALWLGGRADEACRYWEMTERVAVRLLAPVDRPSDDPAPAVGSNTPEAGETNAALDELKALSVGAATKLRAAADRQRVRVAPQVGNSDPQPVAQPNDPDPTIPRTQESAPLTESPTRVPVPKKID